jgi:hypothetical protein
MYKGEKCAGAGFDAVIIDMTEPGGLGGIEAATELMVFEPSVRDRLKRLLRPCRLRDAERLWLSGCGFKAVSHF